MDISALIGVSGDRFLLVLLFIAQITQMILDNQKSNSHKQVSDLTTEIQELRASHQKNKDEIDTLKTKVFELEKENSELRGLLSGLSQDQQAKESLIKKALKKQSI